MPKRTLSVPYLFMLICVGVISAALSGCGSSVMKGVDKSGKKVYLGPVPIENTDAYKQYLQSARTDVDKQNYIFQRLRTPEAQKLSYWHDGSWYTWLEAYRGGQWLIRNRYQKGQDAKTFLQKHVRYSEDTGKPHLVKYPDGTVQEAYFVLLNELELLDDTLAKDPNAQKRAQAYQSQPAPAAASAPPTQGA